MSSTYTIELKIKAPTPPDFKAKKESLEVLKNLDSQTLLNLKKIGSNPEAVKKFNENFGFIEQMFK